MVNTELACFYAAMILYDEGLPISEENMEAILKSVECHVAPYWVAFFCHFYETHDLKDIMLSSATSGVAPAVAASSNSTGAADANAEAEPEKNEEKEEEEDDEGFGFAGLF